MHCYTDHYQQLCMISELVGFCDCSGCLSFPRSNLPILLKITKSSGEKPLKVSLYLVMETEEQNTDTSRQAFLQNIQITFQSATHEIMSRELSRKASPRRLFIKIYSSSPAKLEDSMMAIGSLNTVGFTGVQRKNRYGQTKKCPLRCEKRVKIDK